MKNATVKNKAHYCVRVYGNGQAKHTYRDEEGMKGWIEYNRSFRGGCALFVDGKYQDGTGVFGSPLNERISAAIMAEIARGEHNKPAEEMRNQIEVFGGCVHRYFGYGEEPYRADFIRLMED